MLFDPLRHEPLTGDVWNSDRAEEAIHRIVGGTREALARHGHWPPHPDDLEGRALRPAPCVYFGSAGIIWALAQFGLRYPNESELLRRGAAESLAMDGDSSDDYRRGLLLGPAGIELVACLLSYDAELADDLFNLVRANIANPAREFMWGSPGTMLAAKFMHDATGDPRWRQAFLDSAVQLYSELTPSSSVHAKVWVQHLYGHKVVYLGAVHGFAGNMAPVIVGKNLLPSGQFALWRELAFQTTRATVLVEDGLANWPPGIDAERSGSSRLVQHCHGAPGIIVALGALIDGSDADFDALMLKAGELVWTAGPLRKGAGLCHGTGGNGFAFLRLFQQTQDDKWLARARAFAMHAIGQSEQAQREHGDLRHSLWTGDIGFALYLKACVNVDPRFPTMGYF